MHVYFADSSARANLHKSYYAPSERYISHPQPNFLPLWEIWMSGHLAHGAYRRPAPMARAGSACETLSRERSKVLHRDLDSSAMLSIALTLSHRSTYCQRTTSSRLSPSTRGTSAGETTQRESILSHRGTSCHRTVSFST